MPSAADGEPKGKRNLVRWDDDKDKQLLLCLQYACVNAGIRIPWDKVAKHMGPKFSGGACVQHLAKLRNRMQEEGITVPPTLPRGMVTSTPSRVYSQAPGGKRRRGASADDDDIEPLNPEEEQPKPAKKRKVTKKEPDIKQETDREGTPELYDSDGEYGAKPKKATKSKAKPKKGGNKKNTNNNRRKSASQDAEEQPAESTPAPAVQTRGVRKNYAQMDMPVEEDEDVKTPVPEMEEPVEAEPTDAATNAAENAVANAEDTIKDEEDAALLDQDVASQLPDIQAVATHAVAAEPIVQPHVHEVQASQAVAPLTPSSEQAPQRQAVPRNQVVDNSSQFPYGELGGQYTVTHPPWGYTVNSGPMYPMGMTHDEYMTAAPAQFMYDSPMSDQKQAPSAGNNMLNLGNNFPPTPTPTGRTHGPRTFNISPRMTQINHPMAGADSSAFLQSDFDFATAASRASSRNNSKESIRSQETLMALPGIDGGEELDLSGFSGDNLHFDDPDAFYSGFVDFEQGA